MSTNAPLRILIADDSQEIRGSIERLLSLESSLEIVGLAADGQRAIELARSTQPDIAILDVAMPRCDGVAASEQILAESPSTRVILMSVDGDPEALRRGMRAGAREFLTKPFDAEELGHVVRRVAGLRAFGRGASGHGEGQPGRVVTVFGPKGGVGRTTLASNLAVAAHVRHRVPIALVDADLTFGDAGILLGLQPAKDISDLAAHAADLDLDLMREILVRHRSGIDVLPAPGRPEGAEKVSADLMRRALETLRRSYRLVVVDTGPNFSEQTLAALDLSDQIILLLTVEMPAIRNARSFLDVTARLGYPGDRMTVVLNRADSTGGIEVGEIERVLGHAIDARIVSDGRLATLALNRGEPLVTMNPRARIARGIAALADRLLPEEVARRSRPGVVSRLLASLRLSRTAPSAASA